MWNPPEAKHLTCRMFPCKQKGGICFIEKIVLVLCLIWTAGTDLHTRRIGNRLILGGYLLGLIYRCTDTGIRGMGTFLIHIGLPVIFLYLFYLTHLLGAGDIKLFSMISGLTNWKEYGWLLVFSVFAAAVWCVPALCKGKRTIPFAPAILTGALFCLALGKW